MITSLVLLTVPDRGQDAVGLLGHLGTLLAHVQPAVDQHPQVLLCQAALQPLCPKLLELHGVVVTQVQDPTLGLIEIHPVSLSPLIQPVQIPLQSLSTHQHVDTPTQLGVVCELNEGALDPLVQIIDKDVKENWPQYRALWDTTRDRPPTGFNSIHHHSLGPGLQRIFNPAKSPPVQAVGSQLLQENAVGNCIKGLAKVQVNNIHSLSFIHQAGHFVLEGDQDEMRKAKASLELKLARGVKVKKTGFFKYIGGKRKMRENVSPLLNETGAMVTEDAEKAELLNAFFASVFTAQGSPQEFHTLKETEKVWMKEDFPLVNEDQVREQLSELDIRKSMGPDGTHPRVLRELEEVIAGLLSIIFERSWRTGEVPEDWRKANITPVFKKGKKEGLGDYRLVSLTSIPGKTMGSSFWAPSQSIWRKRKLSEGVNTDSPRGDHV
ncbi:rna-directed dna polymerase from mobile element jockey- hypothetical protein [Limosa lapponica baueri]|uniref:Rna-directed dna polymerase from mobile element jockey-like n=1 Tax=Limosa lapponica baueri TaxID=1758121 RepID=A0A2I0U0J3_LIMLA|nr:rna-directed dna polymerase from mobile element jockey- hypothetical protein [Limosa lapponica baueri]